MGPGAWGVGSSLKPQTPWSARSLGKRLEQMGSCRMPQLAQRLVLDLADALASHVKGPTDLFEGVLGTITDAEAQFQNLLFARGQ